MLLGGASKEITRGPSLQEGGSGWVKKGRVCGNMDIPAEGM